MKLKKYFWLNILLIFFLSNISEAETLQEKVKREADYIVACQQDDPGQPAYGAINDISGEPTWVVPRENGMAILGLILASEILNDQFYLDRAQLTADYLVSIQDPSDGAWCNQYSYSSVVDSAKSPTQTTEVLIALFKLGYSHNRYEALKKGAQYLMECQKVENIEGFDHGLLGGGKDSLGEYSTWRWASDNSYAYWALKAAEAWANIEGSGEDLQFASECAVAAEKIIYGINTHLYNSETGVWHIVIDENGVPVGNPDLQPPYNNLPNWINYAPQMLDLPVNGVNQPEVGDWIKDTFQQDDGSCIAYAWENNQFKIGKYPGYSFQASLCWFDTSQNSYADSTINWAENSGLWQKTTDGNGLTGGWIDWIEVEPEQGKTADWWLRFIDTSFYSIACWNGGYDFSTLGWLLNMPVPWYLEQNEYYSASASCKMILDYISEGNLFSQNDLYEFGHSNNHPDNNTISDIDPQGVRSALNYYHPAGYNFEIRLSSDVTVSMRDICHWIDYEVPGVNITNVPAAVPTFGSYDNWMVVRGACASKDPSIANTFTVYGFWINDPSVSGIGANSFKTASEWISTYFIPLNTTDIWQGKYVSVCEPPEIMSKARIRIKKYNNRRSAGKLKKLMQINKCLNKQYKYRTNSELTDPRSSYAKVSRKMTEFSWKDLIDERLLQDKSFKKSFVGAIACVPIRVKRLDRLNEDYYIIPFDRKFRGNYLTSSAILIDAISGNFKEASWVNRPVRYFNLAEKEAIKLVLNKIKPASRSGVDTILSENIKAELVWKPCAISSSPYHPFWKVVINSKVWYVNQDGVVFTKLLEKSLSSNSRVSARRLYRSQ